MKFLDQAKIYVKSGKGGNVYFETGTNLNTLIDYRYQQHCEAGNGRGGAGRLRSGLNGKDLVLRVPVGTQVLDEDKETVLLDLTVPGERKLFLKGGDGGFGNDHYKS